MIHSGVSSARSVIRLLIAPFVLVAAATLLSASAAPQSGGQRSGDSLPFRVGETLTYDVSWSQFLTAGTVTLAVKERQHTGELNTYHIVGEARPTPLLSRLYSLYYRAETWLDADTLLPDRGSTYSEEGRRKRYKLTTFDRGAQRAQYEMRTATLVRQELAVPGNVQDVLSALYVLRTTSLKPGVRLTVPVADSGKVYDVRFVVNDGEAVKTGIGAVRAVRVTPEIVGTGTPSAGRRMTLWISDDAMRLPLRFEVELAVGSFVVTLRDRRG